MIDGRQRPCVRLTLTPSTSILIALLGLFLVRYLVPASWLHADNEVAGNYLQTLGTIYAVLLAFVAFVVWEQHNATRSAVESEVNALSDFTEPSRGCRGPSG